jgi:hypothetical protein
MKEITLNMPQLWMESAPQPNKFWEGGRGCGKSYYLGRRIIALSLAMPRGTFAIGGNTFSQILTRTIPSTKNALEQLGWIEDKHYVIGKKPPAKYKWDKAYEAPSRYDNFLSTFTGAGFHLVSMAESNGRGLNIDGAIADELSTFDEDKFNTNITATMRGNVERFKGIALHHSFFGCFNIPIAKKGEWVYKVEQESVRKPHKYFYFRSSSKFNAHNLGEEFFERQRSMLTPLLYSMEIDNVRPKRLEGGFYPTFSDANIYAEKHNENLSKIGFDFSKMKHVTSLIDGDCTSSQPLDIALDYGANINCLVVGQYNYSNADFTSEYQVLKSFYVKWPMLLEDVVQQFCEYYSSHKNKHINYINDQTANGRKGDNSLKFKQTVITILEKNGWIVNDVYVGEAPGHHSKYIYFGRIFKGDRQLPKVLINETNAASLVVSLNNAGVREGRNGFEKDKRPERSDTIPDEETTHLSDAFDTLLYFKFINLVNSIGDFI